MALANFDDLKQSIIKWSHRSDLTLLVPDFIQLAEVRMFNNPLAVLEVAGQEATDNSLTTTARVVALPTDYQSMRSIRLSISDDSFKVIYRAPEQMTRVDITGQPCFFTVIGTNIEFDREPDQVYTIELKYYAKPTALSSSNATNTVLTNNPDVYLYGALEALFTHAVDEEQRQKYSVLFITSITGANNLAKKGRFGPAPQMRVSGYRP